MHDTRVNRAQETAMAMLKQGKPLREILTYLVNEAEAASDGVCSVLLIDAEGLLRNGASPGLPADYLDAIDRLKPDPAVGTCCRAAATGEVVITPSFLTDDGWKELKHLPLALGLQSAWSQPIVGANGRVLGTFGTYFRVQRQPRAEERSFVAALARIASSVIERGTAPTAGAAA